MYIIYVDIKVYVDLLIHTYITFSILYNQERKILMRMRHHNKGRRFKSKERDALLEVTTSRDILRI